jgi:hypothetical protein
MSLWHKVCVRLQDINRHLRKSHSIFTEQTKNGRPAKDLVKQILNPHFRSGVYYQRLFLSGPRCKHFEVNSEARSAEASDQEVNIKYFFENRSLVVRKDVNMVEQPEQSTQRSPWLDRVGFVTYLQNFADKRDFLRRLISLNLNLNPEGVQRNR